MLDWTAIDPATLSATASAAATKADRGAVTLIENPTEATSFYCRAFAAAFPRTPLPCCHWWPPQSRLHVSESFTKVLGHRMTALKPFGAPVAAAYLATVASFCSSLHCPFAVGRNRDDILPGLAVYRVAEDLIAILNRPGKPTLLVDLLAMPLLSPLDKTCPEE